MQAITILDVVRQTEKAVLIRSTLENCVTSFERNVWWPKSQIDRDGDKLLAPAWLIEAKLDEYRHGNFDVWFN